jgi:hypothetical protein
VAVSVISCVSPTGDCERSAFWLSEDEPKLQYAKALDSIFEFGEDNWPTENELLYLRVDYLEKYCYQTRVK